MKNTKQKPAENPNMPLGKRNYRLIGIGILMIVSGFILLSGGGSEGPDEFNYAMFSFRRLFVAPLLMLGGFVFEIYAVMYRPRDKKEKRGEGE